MEKDDKKVKYDGKPIDHEYDGIQELNNPIPPWLQYLFFISVAFSLFYWLYYHVWTGDLQEQEYQKEMAAAQVKLEKHKADTKQLEIVLLTDAESLTAGETIYKEKLCATCHGQLGEGNAIGPNLTDKYWIHGGTIDKVFETIKNGVPTKGMTPFKDQLPDEKILQVASYVLHTLRGTNPPNAKEPQGVLVE